MPQVKVRCLRHLQGDKPYKPGDTRLLDRGDAERLEATGAVKIVAQKKAATKAGAAK